MKPVSFAVVGCGYWGPNFIRNLESMDEAEIGWICDIDSDRLKKVHRRFPATAATLEIDDILNDALVEVVVLATPTSTHHALGKRVLQSGKHLLVEKPLAGSLPEAHELATLARSRNLLLCVDHTFVYGGPVRKIRQLVQEGHLGDVLYIDSTRINLGLFQSDINVLWDLAPHDLSIIDYIVGGIMPEAVTAIGDQENLAYLTMRYPSGLLAHVNVNWLAPVKVRQMLVGGSKRMLIYDDTVPSEKIHIYDRGAEVRSKEDVYGTLVQYRMGDVWAPMLDTTEAILTQLREIVLAVRTGSEIAGSVEAGLRVVEILVAADESLRSESRLVRVDRVVAASA
jgi:predicted dehydrogenase